VLRARAAGLDGALVDALNDEALQARVYGHPTPPTHHRTVPDCAYLHAERRKPGVTLKLPHLEYLEQHPDGYRYTQLTTCRWIEEHDSPGCRTPSAAISWRSWRTATVSARRSSRANSRRPSGTTT
jgi:hypothetical protein